MKVAHTGGFVLLPVTLMLVILAALAWMMNHEGAAVASRVQRAEESHAARYVAEAGIAHAKWTANESGCSGYALGSTQFGDHQYVAAFSPNSGSPVEIQVTSTTQNGLQYELSSRATRIYGVSKTVVIKPNAAEGKDASIDGSSPGWIKRNSGTSNILTVSGFPQSALLQFDFPPLNANAHIESAQLSLHLDWNQGSTAIMVQASALSRDWNEGTLDWGFPADGVTWNTYDGSAPWTSPGGDYNSTWFANATIPATSGVRHTIDMASLANRWVNGAQENFGVLLRRTAGNTGYFEFASSDHADPTKHPSLTLRYRCECGTVCDGAGVAGPARNLLMVVLDSASLTAAEQKRKVIIESFNFNVTTISENASAADFRAAVLLVDVVFINEDVSASAVNSKLSGTHIGVVSEEPGLADELGVWQGFSQRNDSIIDISDNTHFITETFAIGSLTLFSSAQPLAYRNGSIAGGAQVLATITGSPAVVAIDKGMDLYPAGKAPGRRVQLPWIGDYDPDALTADGLTLLERSLLWASEVPDPITAAYFDRFELSTCSAAVDYSNSDGVLDWSTSTWFENDDGDSCGGNVRIGVDGGDHALAIDKANKTITRAVNLDGATYATLIVQYRRVSFDFINDQLRVEMSSDSGGSWSEVARIQGPANDAEYQTLTVDLMDYAGADSMIRLRGFALSSNGFSPDKIWIDDLRIETDSAGELSGGGGGCAVYLLDEFETVSYSNNDGSNNWDLAWSEVGENDGADAGNVRITSFDGGSVLQIQNKKKGAERRSDLSAFSTATLSFDYWRDNLKKSKEDVAVSISANGGSSRTELHLISGPATDTVWQSVSFDISAYLSTATEMQFLAGSLKSDAQVYIDNVKVCLE